MGRGNVKIFFFYASVDWIKQCSQWWVVLKNFDSINCCLDDKHGGGVYIKLGHQNLITNKNTNISDCCSHLQEPLKLDGPRWNTSMILRRKKCRFLTGLHVFALSVVFTATLHIVWPVLFEPWKNSFFL